MNIDKVKLIFGHETANTQILTTKVSLVKKFTNLDRSEKPLKNYLR